MKKNIIIWLSLLLFFISPGVNVLAGDDKVREPVWAGAFYAADSKTLKAEIARLTSQVKAEKIEIPAGKHLKAIIMPHAGYIYSGWTAAHASLVLSKGQFSKVVLLGPDHRVGFSGGAVSGAESYQTPIGLVPVHGDTAKLLSTNDLFRVVPESESSEHSLEVIIPFLQDYLGEFSVVPITLGAVDIGRVVAAIDPLLDEKSLLVASSDLSHYLPYGQAVLHDKKTITAILAGDTQTLQATGNNACGKAGIEVVLEIARRHNWQPTLLHYSNSGDTAGSHDKVVGYATIAFFGGEEMKKEQSGKVGDFAGQALVKLARHAISEQLAGKKGKNPAGSDVVGDAALASEELQAKRGVFVTLHKNGELRGCIGSLAGVESITEGTRRHAENAAFNDYRFKPLTEDELELVDIEVSILTEPQPLSYTDANDLLAKLRVNIDGAIIRQGPFSATFLPQVWEQLPDPRDFLSHLCQKAGLSPNAWQEGKLEVLTYQVQYFHEQR